MADLAQLAKYGQTFGGKDKTMRLVQYACRSAQHYMLVANPTDVTGLLLKDIWKTLSLHRKFFRYGRLADDFLKAQKALFELLASGKGGDGALDVVKRMLKVVQHSFMFVFVAHDHCIWLVRNKLSPTWMTPLEAKISARSLKIRVISDAAAVVGSLLDMCATNAKIEDLRKRMAGQTRASDDGLALAEKKRKEQVLETAKYAMDILTYMPQVPAFAWTGLSNTAGYHDGIIGLMGTISSLISMRKEWKAVAPKK